MSNPYRPKRVTSWIDLVLVCILAWVLILITIVWLPELVIELLR